MPKCSYRWAVALLIGLSAAMAASASAAEPTAIKADPQELVIGDWYEVSIQKDGMAKQVDGHLIKTTDEWIVLGTIRCAGNVVSNYPTLAQIPYLGRLFCRTEPCYSKCYKWLPRSIVIIENRMRVEKGKLENDFKDDSPKLEAPITVYKINGKEASAIIDDLVEIQDNQVCITSMKAEVEEVRKSPAKERIIQRRQQTKIPFDDVLFIWHQVPYDYLKNHPEAKQAANSRG